MKFRGLTDDDLRVLNPRPYPGFPEYTLLDLPGGDPPGYLRGASRKNLSFPAAEAWQDFIVDHYQPPNDARLLVLHQCSWAKPYDHSATLQPIVNICRRFSFVHRVVVSNVGLIPAELQMNPLFCSYDWVSLDGPEPSDLTAEFHRLFEERLMRYLDAHHRNYDAVLALVAREPGSKFPLIQGCAEAVGLAAIPVPDVSTWAEAGKQKYRDPGDKIRHPLVLQQLQDMLDKVEATIKCTTGLEVTHQEEENDVVVSRSQVDVVEYADKDTAFCQERNDECWILDSSTEWGKLREIIVGDHYRLTESDVNIFRSMFGDGGNRIGFLGAVANPQLVLDETAEDLEVFVSILREFGAMVHRPEVPSRPQIIKTPYWSAPLNHPLMMRDLYLVLGRHLIETSPMVRSRKMERECLTSLFSEYFKRGADWVVVPPSRLLKQNYDENWMIGDKRNSSEDIRNSRHYEIMFDGAQILRFGRDIVFNTASQNHELGFKWLQQYLGDSYKVHSIQIGDFHIDGHIIPLRPGTLLVQQGVDISLLPGELPKWDVIYYEPLSDKPKYRFNGSESIGMNVLSLDQETVIVQDIQSDLYRKLEGAGFTPVPCRLRHGVTLGGGFHCLTLDTRRDDEGQEI